MDAVEEMDKPDCDLRKLQRTYAQFHLINTVVSGWHGTYLRRIKPMLSPNTATTLLDIGCGGGDIARSLARWATRDGLELEITAIDPDQRAYAFASTQPPVPGLTFRQALSEELVKEGASFDIVISNHILHHLTPAAFEALLVDSERLTRGIAVHSDIARGPAAYALFSVGTLPFFPGSFIRQDGLTSIRRSYTAAELATILPTGWQVQRERPHRNVLLYGAGTHSV